jgi:hypothetical protein
VETREGGEGIDKRHVYRGEASYAIVACGSAVDIAASVALKAYRNVHNRVRNLLIYYVFAGFSRSWRLWMAFVVAACGRLASDARRRLPAMHDGVGTDESSTATCVSLRGGSRASPDRRAPVAEAIEALVIVAGR